MQRPESSFVTHAGAVACVLALSLLFRAVGVVDAVASDGVSSGATIGSARVVVLPRALR